MKTPKTIKTRAASAAAKPAKTRFSPESRERAVRLVHEQRNDHPSHWPR
jgi:hypothetical protein